MTADSDRTGGQTGGRIAADILRIRAPNPSPMTGSGTNTWCLGERRLLIVDPGPDDDDHLARIVAATAGRRVAGILLTHGHRDHTALAPRLAQALDAPLMAFAPSQASGRAGALGLTFDRSISQPAGTSGARDNATEQQAAAPLAPDIALQDGDEVEGWAVLHTPGHMHDHICLWRGDGTLVTGDTVMGWATSIIPPPSGDLIDYMASLARLAALRPRLGLPGHGEVLADAGARIATLAAHRRAREASIVAALAEGPATCTELTARSYAGLPEHLRFAAELTCIAHLIALASEGRATTTGGPWRSAVFAKAG
ncbi:MAG: MBL fold metallo-hydrolase [Rubellimicrobium sp.]|nr:MBL fold metallo-hydrolase [Rubellimicrobium sp.]